MRITKSFLLSLLIAQAITVSAQKKAIKADPKAEVLKKEVIKTIDGKLKTAQEMVDQVFSYSELGFQEKETSNYLTGLLEKNGFTVERGIGGIPTAWMAKWGNGKPVIALGSDIDGIPKASQKPGACDAILSIDRGA